MTDRELLELAAKASGLYYYWTDGDVFMTHGDTPGGLREWNPMTDDGDAFRLAVELSLDICRPYAEYHSVCVWADKQGHFIEELLRNDPLAATRRAIVRAAAEIGRAMG